MKRFRTLAAAGFAVAVASTLALGAGNYLTYPQVGQPSFCAATVSGAGGLGGATGQGQASSGSVCAQTIPAGPPFLTGLELVPADTVIGANGQPQTVTIPLPMLGNYYGTPRNFIDNGALNITNTNGTSTVTCAVNAAIAVANLSADRWGCQANVAVGAGRTAIVTSSPSPPTGFTNSMKVFRTSGALTQPICVMQEIPTPQSIQLSGQGVTFSFYAAALAGLNADNANQIQAVIFTGTGTDEGLTTAPTASPAITPAWTGITTPLNQTLTITTTFTRYAVSATIPATATEIGVALCFTPTATGSGATDGFAFTGAQVERSPGATAFEFRAKEVELANAQQFFYKITEGAIGSVRTMGFASTTSLVEGLLQFPVTMYKTPTMGYTAGFAANTTTAGGTYANCTAIRTSTLQAFAPDVNRVMIECTSAAAFAAAGSPEYIGDNGGSGVITAWTGL